MSDHAILSALLSTPEAKALVMRNCRSGVDGVSDDNVRLQLGQILERHGDDPTNAMMEIISTLRHLDHPDKHILAQQFLSPTMDALSFRALGMAHISLLEHPDFLGMSVQDMTRHVNLAQASELQGGLSSKEQKLATKIMSCKLGMKAQWNIPDDKLQDFDEFFKNATMVDCLSKMTKKYESWPEAAWRLSIAFVIRHAKWPATPRTRKSLFRYQNSDFTEAGRLRSDLPHLPDSFVLTMNVVRVTGKPIDPAPFQQRFTKGPVLGLHRAVNHPSPDMMLGAPANPRPQLPDFLQEIIRQQQRPVGAHDNEKTDAGSDPEHSTAA